jgi:hypothetical protein
MNLKPLQTYLNEQERSDLELIAKALGEKTLSSTIKKLIHIFMRLSLFDRIQK